MPQIICKWCGKQYQAFNNNRGHCSKIECRTKEIEQNLLTLSGYFSTLLRHGVIAQVELRCPGNDCFGAQVKITTESCINYALKDKPPEKQEIQESVDMLVDYFRPILKKGVKGNFIVKTLSDGKIDEVILNQSFTSFREPENILGNNCFISRKHG